MVDKMNSIGEIKIVIGQRSVSMKLVETIIITIDWNIVVIIIIMEDAMHYSLSSLSSLSTTSLTKNLMFDHLYYFTFFCNLFYSYYN